MATSARKQAILATVGVETSGNAYTHETVEVTKTATMANGSFLKSDNTEAAIADVAVVDSILDFPEIELYEDGDVMLARIAKRNVIANYDVVQFSDAAFGGEALALLDARGVIFQAATATFEYL
jgi:hypothetical protein